MDAGHQVPCPLVDDDVVVVDAVDPHDTLDEGRVPVVHALVLDLDLRFSAEAPLRRGPRLEPRLAHALLAAVGLDTTLHIKCGTETTLKWVAPSEQTDPSVYHHGGLSCSDASTFLA